MQPPTPKQSHLFGPMRSRKKRLRLWWNEYQWIAIGIAGVLFFILGYLGFAKFYTADPVKRTSFDLLHMTLQLLRIGTPLPPGAKPWELEAARTFATLLTTFAAVKALMLLFREKFQSLRLSRWRGHVVICGLGAKGAQLAADLLSQGEQVVIIEKDEANSNIESFREDGAIVLSGDAANPPLLKKARVARARLVFVVGGNDQSNLEIALQIHQLMQTGNGKGHDASTPPPAAKTPATEATPGPEGEGRGCFVHLIDLELRELLQRHQIFAGQPGRAAIRCFNIYENAARRLFLDHPPEVAARELGQDEVHLLIVGFGQMGRSVALQAARIGHYAHGRAIRITVIDRTATRKGASFTNKYRQFKTICQISFVDLEVDEVSFLSGSFLEALGGRQSVTQVAICLEQEAAGLICGLNLLQLFGGQTPPLLIRMSVATDLIGRLQAQPSQGQPDGDARTALHPFAGIADSCSSAMVIGEEQDRMARTVHAGYVQMKGERGGDPATDPSMASWARLSDDFRESNRQQTEHLDIKLRTVGCRRRPIAPGESADFAFTEAEIELLAEMEHNRWNAERSLAGWIYGEKKNVPGKISPYIRPWAELSEEIKEYDRDTIRNIPAILAAIGEGVERA